jgi:hypothetical protein
LPYLATSVGVAVNQKYVLHFWVHPFAPPGAFEVATLRRD